LGQEVAGEVVEVGEGVTRFRLGDRVAGQTVAFLTKQDQHKGFQLYTVLEAGLATPLPESMPYEKGVLLPVTVSAASAALFQEDFLNLATPTVPARQPNGEVLLVWGGAGGVGSNAIQLATAAGYEVLTTTSPKNFDAAKRYGAAHVVDYHSETAVADLIAAVRGRKVAGAFDAVGLASEQCAEFLTKTEGPRFLSTTGPFPDPPEGIRVGRVFSLGIRNGPVGKAMYEDFLPTALANGAYVPSPEPLVVGSGLEKIQEAVDVVKQGVSAKKVVVTL
jgi:threonine dehydrogenase-like Zn-dependent dehydrogenase